MILIDADLLVYRCGFAAERTLYYVNGEQAENKRSAKAMVEALEEEGLPAHYHAEEKLEPIENALQMVRSSLTNIIERCDYFGDAKLFLTEDGGENFRNEIATIKEYKGNRKDARKPHWYKEIRDYLIRVWDAEVVNGQEADDAIGIAACGLPPETFVIVSIDKDLDMIPGLHYNWVKDEFYSVSDEEGTRHFYKQLLTGDTTDNIPGVKGIGEKKAEAILAECSDEYSMYNACLLAYRGEVPEEATEPELLAMEQEAYEALTENARLLWIRRKPNELWEPYQYG